MLDNTTSREELLARIAELEAAQRSGKKIKTSARGAISVYGLQRLPVTLYASQWRNLIALIPEIEQFLKDNKGQYAEKPEKAATA